MQIQRLFEIVYLLMEKKSTTANDLAEHFEVSKRTILRDIDTLATAGIPVYTVQGRGGGISILDNYVLNKTVITEEDQRHILAALQGMAATQHMEAKSILGRLQSLFQKNGMDWIEVDFSQWGNGAPDKAKFEALKNAVINQQVVSFSYANSSGEASGRRVCPLRLVFKSRSWYVQAFCLMQNAYRTFKISRIRNLEAINEAFDRSSFQVPAIEASASQSPALIELTLRFKPEAAYRVYDEFDEENVDKDVDGSFIVNMIMPHDYWLYSYVLSFGGLVEVIEPESVRDEIVRQADKIKDIYRNKR